MKIAIDLDGVIINPHTTWYKRISDKIGREVTFEDVTQHRIERALNIDKKIVMDCYTPDIYDDCGAVDGAIAGVSKLSGLGDLVIVSSTHPNFDEGKQRWLKRFFPYTNFDIRFCRHGEQKKKYIGDCAFLIDDFEENFIGIDKSQCYCLLLDKPWNRRSNLGHRVKDWDEVVKLISNWKI